MPERREPFQYAILRVIPEVERGEALNAGVVLLCRPMRYLDVAAELDEARLAALAPETDPAPIRDHLAAIARIAKGEQGGGPIARLGIGERFHWLVAPSSTVVQPSPVHTGLTDDPAGELARLFGRLVRRPSVDGASAPPGGR